MRYRSIIKNSILLAVVSQMVQSCAEEFVMLSDTPIRLEASYTPLTDTRSTTDFQNKAFDNGEIIKVYITSGSSWVGGTADDPATYCTVSNDGSDINTLIPNPQPYYPKEGTVNIYAIYPPRVDKNTSSFKVDYTQKSSSSEGETTYKNNDLMYASINNQPRTDQTVRLQFLHKMSKLIINATGQDDVEVTGVKLININRTVPFTPSTGVLGTAIDKGTIVLEAGGAVLIPPQSVSGEFIEVETNRNVSAKFSLDTSKAFEEGKEYTINLVVGLQSLGLTTNIVNWAKDAGSISITPPDPNAMWVSPIDAVTYIPEYATSPYEPKPTIKPNESSETVLTEGVDYDLQYFGNDHAGTATMIMVGKGIEYGNTALVRSFIIRQATGSVTYPHSTFEFNYKNGDPITGNDAVIVGDGTMTFTSSDPSVASVNSSTGIVTMYGVGTTTITASMADDKNYTAASDSYVLTVIKRNASSMEISLSQDTYVYNGTAHRPSVTVTDAGRQLMMGTDYTLSYSNNINKGTATVSVTGMGDYDGVVNKNFTITSAPNTLIINNIAIKHDDSDAVKATYSNQLAISLPKDRTFTRGATSTWGTPTFTSSNTNVVTVSNTGMVTAVSTGTTIITVGVAEPANQNYYGVNITYEVEVVEVDATFNYTGRVKEWICPLDGKYELAVWGAEGASPISTYSGGKGAYLAGSLYIKKGQKLYIYVGGQGQTSGVGGWNGGGSCTNSTKDAACSGGGGATDISLKGTAESTTWDSDDHFNSRILVAGGGGGALYYNAGNFFQNGYANGGYGGAWNGRAGTGTTNAGGGATRSSAGTARGTNASAGSFGKGGNYAGSSAAGCGGGGWYGGGSGGDNGRHGAGGGGSSYMWNNDSKSYYSDHGGAPSIPSGSTMTTANSFYIKERAKSYGQRSGNGQAKISYISAD